MTRRLGALAERDFRLVFASSTIDSIGDSDAAIALVFAVLHISDNSATAVGIVLTCRHGAAAVVTLAAGVVSDRLPRHLVLVAVSSVLAAVQTVVAALVLSGTATVFLLKTAPPAQLVDAVRTVAAGEALLAPTVTRRLIEEYVRRPPPGGAVTDRLEELTDRELEVLTLMARGLSNSEIAGSLFVSGATVKTHVNRVLSKLDLRDRVQAVVFAYEHGLVRPGE